MLLQDSKAWFQVNAVLHQYFQNTHSANICQKAKNSLNDTIAASTEKLSLQK